MATRFIELLQSSPGDSANNYTRLDMGRTIATFPMRRISVWLATVLALGMIVVGALLMQGPDAAAGPCVVVQRPTMLPEIPEASGLAISRRNPGIIWSHNDSGHATELFALDAATGALRGRVRVPVRTRDWEAIAAGRCPAGHCLYIADIGDNGLARRRVEIYRVPEPAPGDAETSKPEAFSVAYADGRHNAEALFVVGDDLFVVTRDRTGGLYRSNAPLRSGADLTLQRIGQFLLEAVTDAAASPDEASIVVRTSDSRSSTARPMSFVAERFPTACAFQSDACGSRRAKASRSTKRARCISRVKDRSGTPRGASCVCSALCRDRLGPFLAVARAWASGGARSLGLRNCSQAAATGLGRRSGFVRRRCRVGCDRAQPALSTRCRSETQTLQLYHAQLLSPTSTPADYHHPNNASRFEELNVLRHASALAWPLAVEGPALKSWSDDPQVYIDQWKRALDRAAASATSSTGWCSTNRSMPLSSRSRPRGRARRSSIT
jgi:hypothetical protein